MYSYHNPRLDLSGQTLALAARLQFLGAAEEHVEEPGAPILELLGHGWCYSYVLNDGDAPLQLGALRSCGRWSNCHSRWWCCRWLLIGVR